MTTIHILRSAAAAFTVGLMFAAVNEARGQISYSIVGSSYFQDFNSLPNTPENTSIQALVPWTDNSISSGTQTSLPGWYLFHPITQAEGGLNGNQRMRFGPGSANTGAFWSYGSSASADRALGILGANTLAAVGADIYAGLRLINDTGVTLDSFTLSCDGEQWRDGGSAAGTPTQQSMTFMWSTTATSISDANSAFTTMAALGYSSPVFVASTTGAGAVDGNVAGLVPLGPVTVSGINWLPGTDLWLRWSDVNHPDNDHGLAIDNVSFTAAVPEPSIWILVGVGCAGLLMSHRLRKR